MVCITLIRLSRVSSLALRDAQMSPGPRRVMPAGVALFLSSWRQPCFAGFVSRSASENVNSPKMR